MTVRKPLMLRLSRISLYALLLALTCMLITPLSASACGGLFAGANSSYTEQSAERMIYAVDPGQVTLYEQINYTGSPSDFAWVLPVPATPKVETAPISMFSELDSRTSPSFDTSQFDPHPCLSMPNFGHGAAASTSGQGAVNVYSSGAVGPYSYDVIGSSDPQAVVQWLTAHHYQIPAESVAEMRPYIVAHMQFLAMRLHGNAGVQDMLPVKITYATSSSEISIPLRMATPMGKEPLSVLLWVFGRARYVPQNYQSVTFTNNDFNNVTDPATINNVYTQKVSQAVSKARGHAFITEYAGPSTGLYFYDPVLQTLAQQGNHSFVTRMFARIAPEQINLDPIFVVNGTVPVSNIHVVPNPNYDPNGCEKVYIVTYSAIILFPVITTWLVEFLRRRRRLS